MSNIFSGPVTVFHGLLLPEEAIPAGYVALIDAYQLPAPFHTADGFGFSMNGSWEHPLISQMQR